MMKSNVTPLVEGGLLTAIAVILGLATVYLPILGLAIEFFCAVPIVVLTFRQGEGKGLMSLTVSFVLLAMFVGPILAMRIALSFGICGLILGYCLRRGLGAVKCFVATLVTAFIAQVIAIGLLTTAMGINVMETEISAVKESFEQTFQMYESMGVDQETISQARAQVEPTLQLLGFLMPTILMLMAVFNALACYLTSQWIFKKLRLKFAEPMPPFAEWRFPIIFLYVAAFSILGVYWGGTRGWDLLYTISINATFISMTVGLLQGLSLLSCLADRYNVSKLVRRIIFVIIILNMMTLEIVAFTGLFDMIFDYRKKIKRE